MMSTLVETVSLNYEDFNDSFLTCSTCRSTFDAQEHAPKLLPCSHTVCRSCLEHIAGASNQNNENDTFRCPMCRETIGIPHGGVRCFPPSFIVNQLLDLMSSQRRDVIPKCSSHPSQELLFCETCDTVFCTLCSGSSHSGRGASAHTVIPFAIAIKRMSEILLYKASLCMTNLNSATNIVSEEVERLNINTEKCLDIVSTTFQNLINIIERRKLDVISIIQQTRDEKQQVLEEQLDIIDGEQVKVEEDCTGLQHQLEVRQITGKISGLNEKLDSSTNLMEPRENAFMMFEYEHNSALHDLVNALNAFGRIRISKTFPGLCTAEIQKVVTHLRATVLVRTVDYHGIPRTTGFDPVSADLRSSNNAMVAVKIKDNDNGTYTLSFITNTKGAHKLTIKIFDRPIQDSPFNIEVTDHKDPILTVGSCGAGELQFVQPVKVAIDTRDDSMLILDTGNGRIKCLSCDGQFLQHITNTILEQRSSTGMAILQNHNIYVVNWRSKEVLEMNHSGDIVMRFTCDRFVEPTGVAVNSHNEIVVADNGIGCLLMFTADGSYLRSIGSKGKKDGQFMQINDLCVSPVNDDIIVTDSRIQVFTRSGIYKTTIKCSTASTSTKVQYGGVCIDHDGLNLLVAKWERGCSSIQVYNLTTSYSANVGDYAIWQFNIDSNSSKLKRPSSLATLSGNQVVVTDLGNNAIKVFRYK